MEPWNFGTVFYLVRNAIVGWRFAVRRGGGLAEDLRDPAIAHEFLMASIDEGVAIRVALAKVVCAMGAKELAAKVRMASPNVLRALNPRHNPTQATINRLLRPFRLRLSLALIE